jgi:hypothetical protein
MGHVTREVLLHHTFAHHYDMYAAAVSDGKALSATSAATRLVRLTVQQAQQQPAWRQGLQSCVATVQIAVSMKTIWMMFFDATGAVVLRSRRRCHSAASTRRSFGAPREAASVLLDLDNYFSNNLPFHCTVWLNTACIRISRPVGWCCR